MSTQFFASAYGQELLVRLELRLKAINNPKSLRLRDVIRIVKAHGKEFDEGAASNVDWIASSLDGTSEALEKPESTVKALDELYSYFYRFVGEYELTLPGNIDLSMELRQFQNFAREETPSFSEAAQRNFRFADVLMPIQIMKRLLGSDVLMNIRNIQAFSGEIEKRLSDWDTKVVERQTVAQRLHDSLKEYETGFNFGGLHKGFDDLSVEKCKEHLRLRRVMIWIGIAALLPIGLEFFFVLINLDRFDQLKWALLASAVPALSFTLLLIYYFRLTVRSVDGVKSQLLQLDLRKTLCRFIQSYVEYAKKAKDGGMESLVRFENVVFSGIVNTDEKMPATFDGLEQIAGLIKSLKGP